MQLRENPPASRMRWVAKTYAKRPDVVVATLEAAFHLLGIDEHVPNNFWGINVREGAGVSEYVEASIKRLPLYSRYDFILPWVAAQLNKLQRPQAEGVTGDLARYGTSIAQWALANRVDLGRVSLNQAIAQASAFRVAGPAEPGEVIYKFADGWTLQKLTTASQLEAEGEIMQHCVGTYCERVDTGKAVIYSLRDAQGHPHVTMEWSVKNKRFKQIQGKQNRFPAAKYLPYIWEVILNVFHGNTVSLLLSHFDFKAHGMEIDLDDADLAYADLERVNLAGAHLRNANLENAWLAGANLAGADLRGANLREASLTSANLRGADLRDANLHFTALMGADLTGADLTGAAQEFALFR